jgi:hypothetical protein
MPKTVKRATPAAPGGFDLPTYLGAAGTSPGVVSYRRGEVIFAQGDAALVVKYIQAGAVKLSVLSRIGKEAVVHAAPRFFRRGYSKTASERRRR